MPVKYHSFLRILHWVMALLIITMLFLGWYMANMVEKNNPLRGSLYDLHKSIGVTLLILVIIRIAIRLATFIPPLPATIHPLIRAASQVSHYTLYIFMVIMPLSGYGMSNSFGRGVALFGIPLPKILPDDKEIGGLLRQVHGVAGYVLMGLVALHVAAALWHRFFDKKENDVLPRMV